MLRILGAIWRRWLKLAELIGTAQMVLLLSLVYWLVVPFLAIPFKLLADPLGLKRPGRARWVRRSPTVYTVEAMRRQG